MRKHTPIAPYGAEMWLCTTRRDLDWVRAKLDVDDDREWNSEGQVFSYRAGVHGETPVSQVFVVCVDLEALRAHPTLLTSTTIHEAVHVGAWVLDFAGQAYDGKSEALAYLIDWVASWLLEQVGL